MVIVSIEDQTITGRTRGQPAYAGRWTAGGTRRSIDELHEAGAKVIAYDVQFTEPSGETEEDIEADNALDRGGRARRRRRS